MHPICIIRFSPLVALVLVLCLVQVPILTLAREADQVARNEGSHFLLDKSKKKMIERLKKMGITITEEELPFYYFSLHDTNADEHLDGTELRKAFMTYNDDEPMTVELADKAVDNALLLDDHDNDGRISWKEMLASESLHNNVPSAKPE